MTITLNSTGTAVAVDGTSTGAMTAPSHTTGDVRLLQVLAKGTSSTTPTPAGWTLLGTIAKTTTHRMSVFYRVATSASDGNVTATQTVSGLIFARETVWRGCDTTTPIDVTPVITSAPKQASASASSITPVSVNAMAIWLFGKPDDNTIGSQSQGTLAYSSDTTTGSDGNIALVYELQTTATATGVCTMTEGANGTDNWTLITVALRPAAVAAANPARDLGFDSITYAVEVAFGSTPFSPSPVWTDIAADVRAADGIVITRGTNSPFSETQPGTMSLTLNNRSRTYDPDYSAGTYFGQLLPMTPIRLRVRKSSTNYPIYYGFVQGWVQNYDPPREATCTVNAVDLFGLLNRRLLPPTALTLDVLADAPLAYWPMLEDDATIAADLTGNGYDTGYPFEASEATDSFLIGESGQKAKTFVEEFQRTVDQVQITQTATETIYGVEGWLRVDSLSSVTGAGAGIRAAGVNSILTVFGGDAGLGDGSQAFTFTCSDATTVVATLTAPFNTDTTYHVAATLDSTLSTFTAYVNGQTVGSASVTAGTFDAGTRTGYFNVNTDEDITVEFAHVAFYGAELTATRVLSHYLNGSSGGNLDTAATRLTAVADFCGLVDAGTFTTVNIDANTYLAPVSYSGTALAEMQTIITAEQGRLFVNASGVLTAQGRAADLAEKTENVTSNGTWADSGTLAYAGVHTVPGHVDTLRNTEYVSVTGATIKTVDAGAVQQYGEASESVSTTLQDPTAGRNLGLYRLRRFAAPSSRVDWILIRPHGTSDTRYTQVFTVDLGWKYVVQYTPQAVGSAISKTVTVAGLQHVITEAKWETTLYLDPSVAKYTEQPWFVLGDATYGKPGSAFGNQTPY